MNFCREFIPYNWTSISDISLSYSCFNRRYQIHCSNFQSAGRTAVFKLLVLEYIRYSCQRKLEDPGELGVSKSMECDIFPSVLRHCWLGDRKGIQPVKSWVLICWRCQFDCSFARLVAPVVATTSIIFSFSNTG